MKIFSDNNVLKGLDDYNLRAADAYLSGCEPAQIEPDSEHHSGDYNCHNCDDKECEYWADYNGVIPVGYGINNETSLKMELNLAKGKVKRKIRRQLKKLKSRKGE
jgi:hypothetical protein